MALPIHLPSVVLASSVLYAVFALLVWAVMRHRAGHLQASLWAAGSLAMGLGASLIALRERLPLWATYPLANALLFGAYALRVTALRRELGNAVAAWRPALLWALLCGGYLACLALPAMVYRVGYGYTVLTASAAAAAYHAAQLRRRHGLRAAGYLAVVEGALALAFGLRLLAIAAGIVEARPIAGDGLFVLILVCLMAAALLGNFGYLDMALERSRLLERRAHDAVLSERARREGAERSAEQLRQLLAQRDELLSERDRTLRMLAHEIRQPLHNAGGALQAATQSLQARPSAPSTEIAAPLRRAQAVLGEVQSVLDNTLAAATLIAQRRPLTRQDVDLDLLVALTLRDLPDALAARVGVQRPPDLRTAELEPGLVRLALRNLLRNAATHGGGGPIELRLEEVDEPPALLLTVADQGRGLPAAQLQALAGAGSAPLTGTRDGHGLGLAIVHKVSALHGGRLELAANAPQGLLARLVLPQGLDLAAAADPAADAAPATPATGSGRRGPW